MGPGLDWLLYTKRLRKLIRELKAKGDFREEGLQRLHVHLVGFGLLSVVAPPIAGFLAGIQGKSSFASLWVFLFFAFLFFFQRYWFASREIIPYSIGEATDGEISWVDYNKVPIGKRGWQVEASYFDAKGNKKTQRIDNIDNAFLAGRSPKVGMPIKVFVDEKNSISAPFIEGWFFRACISAERASKFLPNNFLKGG